MAEIPDDICRRRDAFCQSHSVELEFDEPLGWGIDGYIWQTTSDTVLKVHFRDREFRQELAVYERLAETQIDRLQGFEVPLLLNYDTQLHVLELSFVRPPFILDFAAAGLDEQPPGFDADSPGWNAEKQRLYGERWPEVVRLLDALRHLGVYYADVHSRNICIDAPRQETSE